MHVCIYIYIYIYMYLSNATLSNAAGLILIV